METHFLKKVMSCLCQTAGTIVDQETTKLLNEIENIGQNQYDDFVEKSLFAFFSPIKKNKVILFGSPSERGKNTKIEKRFLKNDVSLFSQLYIASQVRESD